MRFVLLMTVASLACACYRERPPCDEATLLEITTRCALQVSRCGPYPAPCPAEDACFAELEERKRVCLERGRP